MANDVNNAHSINPKAKVTTDNKPASTGDSTSHFNHSNPTVTAKFRCQTKNQHHHQQQTTIAIITKQQQQQHEATHRVTAYNNTQIEQPETENYTTNLEKTTSNNRK